MHHNCNTLHDYCELYHITIHIQSDQKAYCTQLTVKQRQQRSVIF